MRWDPDEYLRRRTERSRAYDELLARVDVVDAELVVDRLRAMVAPRGALAIGVPASFDQPSHVLPRSLAADTAFAPWTAGLTWPSSAAPRDVSRCAERARVARRRVAAFAVAHRR